MTLYNSQDTFPCYDLRASTLFWYLPQVTAKSDPCIDYQVLWSHATWNHQNSSVKTVDDLALLSVNIIILVFQSVFWSIWSHILRNFWWSKYLYGAVTTELDHRAADGIGGVAISDLDYSPMADYLLWVIRRRRGAKIITHSSRATAHSIQRPSYGVELSISQEFAITLWQRGLAGFQVWKNFTSSKEHYHQPRPMMTWHNSLGASWVNVLRTNVLIYLWYIIPSWNFTMQPNPPICTRPAIQPAPHDTTPWGCSR